IGVMERRRGVAKGPLSHLGILAKSGGVAKRFGSCDNPMRDGFTGVRLEILEVLTDLPVAIHRAFHDSLVFLVAHGYTRLPASARAPSDAPIRFDVADARRVQLNFKSHAGLSR